MSSLCSWHRRATLPLWIRFTVAVTLVGGAASAQAPTITQVFPSTVSEGMPVVIEGSGFSHIPSQNTVRLNGIVGTVLRPVSSGTLVALVPTGAGRGNIEVEVGGQTASSPSPLSVLPNLGLVNQLTLLSPTLQPLDHSVVAGLALTVRTVVDPALLPLASFEAYVVSPGLLTATDVSASFTPNGGGDVWTGSFTVAEGPNTVVVVLNGLATIAGTMINYDSSSLGFGAPMDPNRVSAGVEPDSQLPYQEDYLEIGVLAGTPAQDIRILLETYDLTPAGVFQDTSGTPPHPISVTVDVSQSSLSALQLRDQVELDPVVDWAGLALEENYNEVVGETLPPRLILGGKYPSYTSGNMNVGWDSGNGGFDHDGSMAGGVPTDELDINWRHFFLQTFAAQRLRTYLITKVAAQGGPADLPVIAVVDSGFGNGGADQATNPILHDLPLSRLGGVDPDLVIFDGIDALDGCIWRPIPIFAPFLPDDRRLVDKLIDTAPGGHGSYVALLAAGNGSIVQGLAPSATVIPYRRGNRAGSLASLLDIASRPEVDVVNYSLSATYANTNAATLRSRPFHARLNALNNTGQILVLAAGNCAIDTNRESPQVLTAARGAAATWPLILNVAATDIPVVAMTHGPVGPEETWPFTNFGSRVRVCAPGGPRMLEMDQGGTLRATGGGTSWSAPQASGLAADLIQLDEHLHGTPAEGAPRRQARLRVVQTIEATADDLGSTSATAPRVNNDAGDGPDNNFGYGRINAWKATLAMANNGLSAQHGRTDQAGMDSVFTSLALLDDEDTDWYGFEIVTPVPLSTVWIDGVKLSDAGSNTPQGPDIKAYKGVRSDSRIERGVHNLTDGSEDDDVVGARPGLVVEEDPMSGIVAVGTRVDNRGQFVMTFSIEREDLFDGQSMPKTLSLRKNGAAATDKPYFNLVLNAPKMRTGEVSGVTFDDFVFQVVAPDYGDAGMAPTTMSLENGARHENTSLEWFGHLDAGNLDSVTPEHNAEFENVGGDARVDPDGTVNRSVDHDRDGRDDGWTFFPLSYEPGSMIGRADFRIGVFDAMSPRYANDGEHCLYVNLWIDWDTDGQWEEVGGEHVLDGVQINPAGPWNVIDQGGATITLVANSQDGNSAEFRSVFPVPQIGCNGLLWARARLDYGEDVGRNDPRPSFRSLPSMRDPAIADGVPQAPGMMRGFVHGAARYGEVEDYRIGSDFGDAEDVGGMYPTKGFAGARHIDVHQEWLGPSFGGPAVSREIDADDPGCMNGGTDEDGSANLVDNDGLDDGVFIPPFGPGQAIVIEVIVSSTINARGAHLGQPATNVGQVGIPEDTRDTLPRYDSQDPTRRLYLSGWADWNGDKIWETPFEKIIDVAIDPDTFGLDGQYNVGEPFFDANSNGVHDSGENFTDVFGIDQENCFFPVFVPPVIANTINFRFRLAYGEDEAAFDLPLKESADVFPNNNEEMGGALFGEVEDYVNSLKMFFGVPAGGTITVTIEGVDVVVTTFAGDTLADIAQRIADAINADPTLSALGITAVAIGDSFAVNATIEMTVITDPGISTSQGPTVYCTAKFSSAGCLAQVTTSNPNAQPVSGQNDYQAIANQVQGFKNGIMFFGFSGQANIPFSGGTLCMFPPLGRTPVQNSGGSGGFACDGTYTQLINDAGATNPNLDAGPGTTNWLQFWGRDPQNGVGTLGTLLSNALEVAYQ